MGHALGLGHGGRRTEMLVPNWRRGQGSRRRLGLWRKGLRSTWHATHGHGKFRVLGRGIRIQRVLRCEVRTQRQRPVLGWRLQLRPLLLPERGALSQAWQCCMTHPLGLLAWPDRGFFCRDSAREERTREAYPPWKS